jgi:hypothetical protein
MAPTAQDGPDKAAAPAPYPLLEHVGEPALLTGTLVHYAYGDMDARVPQRTRARKTEGVLAKSLQPMGNRAVREARRRVQRPEVSSASNGPDTGPSLSSVREYGSLDIDSDVVG